MCPAGGSGGKERAQAYKQFNRYSISAFTAEQPIRTITTCMTTGHKTKHTVMHRFASSASYQYIKILTCVCLCVTEVGCSWGGTRLVTCDLRRLNLLNLELCEEC